jgi:hypothetical protein
MPNPDSGNLDSQLGNAPPKFKRKAGGKAPPVNVKPANWGGLPGPTQPRDRSAGVKKLKTHAMSKGL